MLAYRRTGNVPSSSTVPGKPRYRSSEAPQPRKPAAAAAAKTPWSDHAEAAREPAPLPAAARRADEVVKRCRPERQGLLLDLVRDRPSGRAALVKRFADMQEESRRTSTSCAAQIFGCFFSLSVGKSQQPQTGCCDWTGSRPWRDLDNRDELGATWPCSGWQLLGLRIQYRSRASPKRSRGRPREFLISLDTSRAD